MFRGICRWSGICRIGICSDSQDPGSPVTSFGQAIPTPVLRVDNGGGQTWHWSSFNLPYSHSSTVHHHHSECFPTVDGHLHATTRWNGDEPTNRTMDSRECARLSAQDRSGSVTRYSLVLLQCRYQPIYNKSFQTRSTIQS